MPVRAPTPEELEYLKSKGVDISSLPAELDIDDDWKQKAEQSSSKMSQTEAVGKTLKAHAGSILGGGVGVLGTGALMAAGGIAAPFTGGTSIPLSIAGLGLLGAGAMAGSYAGQKGQEALLSDETNRQLQAQAEKAKQEHPITSTVTDIAASALASGGFPSVAQPVRAVSGVARSLIGKGASELEKSAMKNIAIQSAINPAVNAGLTLATTGKLPSLKEVGEQAAGGALFAGHNPLLGKLSPHADVGSKTDVEPTDVEPTHEPTIKGNTTIPEVAPSKEVVPETKVTNLNAEPLTSEEQKQLQDEANFQNAPPSDDFTRYNEIHDRMQQLIKDKMYGGDEFKKLWTESEQIKNKNKGMPPTEESNKNAPGSEDKSIGDTYITSQGEKLTVDSIIENAQKSNKDDPHVALLSQLHLDADSLKTPVEIDSTESKRRSHYNQATDTIHIHPSDVNDKYVIAHEVIHAATSKKLPTEFEGQRGNKLKALMDEYEKAGANPHVREIISAYKETARLLGIDEKVFSENTGSYKSVPDFLHKTGVPHGYAMGDLHEFISEALNNYTFQKHLNRLPSGLKDGQTMWSRLVNAIRRLLGVDVEHNSMLERVLTPIEKLMAQDRPKSKDEFSKKWNEATGSKNVAPDEYKKQYEADKMELESIKSQIEDRKKNNLPIDDLVAKRTEINDKYGGNPREKGKLPEQQPSKKTLESFKLAAEQSYKGFSDEQILKGLKKNIGEEHPDNIEKLNKSTTLDEALSKFGLEKVGGKNPDVVLKKSIQPDNNKYAPPSTEKDVERNTKVGGRIGEFFRSTIDKIRNIDHPAANKVADALHNVLQERQYYTGKQLNPILTKAKGLTSIQDSRLEAAARYERETGKDAPLTMFRTKQERDTFLQAKQSLKDNFQERYENEEPVYRNGQPTMPRRDEFYWPTTTNPKIAETYRQNTNISEIAKLDKTFLDYQKKIGVSNEEAAENLKNWKEAIQGSATRSDIIGNQQFFNAARRSQGVPLPPEFTRPGFVKNLEAYFHRQATDNAYYKHIESNPEVMSALGERKDAWNRPIPEDPSGGIAGHAAVRAQLNEIKGEVGGAGFHNEKALSSLATTLFIGPGTTIHKAISNIVGMTNYADNPYQLGKMLAGIIHDTTTTGLKHVTENGVLKYTARSSTDMLNSNLSFAERLHSLAKTVRDVYSLGDLTDKWGTALLQAGLEKVMPDKVTKANSGDSTQQQLLKRLDSSYEKGKIYDKEGISKLTSALVGSIHGTGDGRTMPPWMAGDSEISGFFKLSHWGISQTNRFMSDIYTPARNGNVTPLLTALFGSAVGGYLIKELREKLQGKKGQIPSLSEINASSQGLKGNIPLIGYNLMASLSYAGFGGMLTQMAKIPIDKIYKNTSQGATFPLDEIVTDLAHTLGQATIAIANDPNLNWLHLTEHLAAHFLTTNFQLGRVAYNQAIDHGLIDGTLAEKKALSDKLGELRRFDMTEGLPYAEQDQSGNPYLNIEQKKFKLEQNPDEIVKQLPPLIENIMDKYKDKPDVMLSKLKALKENSYATFPSIESMPISFFKYLNYLTKLEGENKAQAALRDYISHKVVNEAKASVVP